MTVTRFFIIALVVYSVSTFSLQGNWTVQNGLGLSSDSVTLRIEDFVFRDQQILQKVAFIGCQQMQLQSQFSENQVFINLNSYRTAPIAGLSCQSISNNPLATIYSVLPRIFYFQIDIDRLLLNDPFGATLLTFKRIVLKKTNSIVGIWTMNQYANTRSSLSVEASPSQILFCQGMAVYDYSFSSSRNTIVLKKSKNTCPSKQLTAAIESIRYYRISDSILTFYDKDISLAVEMVFNKQFNPKQSIFIPVAPTGPPSVAPTTPSSVPSTGPNQGISASNLVGNWSIITLFDTPFPKTPYWLLFSGKSISLLGGCNTYTFGYSLDVAAQVIKVESPTSTKKACTDSDDLLYVSGVNKMYKYLVSKVNTGYRLNFYDQKGTIGYALEIRDKTATNNPAPTKITPTAQAVPKAFDAGTVLMLVLNRRDLPRAVVTIDATSLSYSICNDVKHAFSVSDPSALTGSIKVSGGATTSKSCPNDNWKVYSDALNSAVSYTYSPSAKTIIFKNKADEEVVTFNRM